MSRLTSSTRNSPGAAQEIAVVRFDMSERSRYLRWDECRRQVFAGELGWRLPEPRGDMAASGDPHDAHATFYSAESGDLLIGIVRSVLVVHGFPHRELFQHHLEATDLDRRPALVGTLNALAVIPAHRRERYVNTADGSTGTASALLLRASMTHLAEQGVRVILATVLSAVSARTFMRAGFRILDRPFVSRDDDRFALANAGIAMVDLPDAQADTTGDRTQLLAVAAYMERRHQAVLAQGRLETLFDRPERLAGWPLLTDNRQASQAGAQRSVVS